MTNVGGFWQAAPDGWRFGDALPGGATELAAANLNARELALAAYAEDTRLMFNFKGGSASEAVDPRIYMHVGGRFSFRQVDMRPVYSSPTGSARDPSVWWNGSRAALAYTSGVVETPSTMPQFHIAVTDDFDTWDAPIIVDLTARGVADAKVAWAPEFVDDGAVFGVLVSVSRDHNGSTDFSAATFKPYFLPLDRTTYAPTGNAQLITWFRTTGQVIDLFVEKKGGTYHGYAKFGGLVEHGTSSSLLGPYVGVHTGDAFGFGTDSEAPTVIEEDDGTAVLYVDTDSTGTAWAVRLSADRSSIIGAKRRVTVEGGSRHAGVMRVKWDTKLRAKVEARLFAGLRADDWHIVGDATDPDAPAFTGTLTHYDTLLEWGPVRVRRDGPIAHAAGLGRFTGAPAGPPAALFFLKPEMRPRWSMGHYLVEGGPEGGPGVTAWMAVDRDGGFRLGPTNWTTVPGYIFCSPISWPVR